MHLKIRCMYMYRKKGVFGRTGTVKKQPVSEISGTGFVKPPN